MSDDVPRFQVHVAEYDETPGVFAELPPFDPTEQRLSLPTKFCPRCDRAIQTDPQHKRGVYRLSCPRCGWRGSVLALKASPSSYEANGDFRNAR